MPSSAKEIADLIVKLREKYREDFVRWYDMANYPSIEDMAEMGYYIDRYLSLTPGSVAKPDPPSKKLGPE